MENESWKSIKNYEGIYQVSNQGRVKRLQTFRKSEKVLLYFVNQKILAPALNITGYLQVTLCKENVRKAFLIHRLVAQSFIDNPYNLPCVNHIDADRCNNDSSNLQWVTYQENTDHMRLLGRNKNAFCFDLPHTKLSDEQVIEIHQLFIIDPFSKSKDVAEQYGVSPQTICDIKNGRARKHLFNKANL